MNKAIFFITLVICGYWTMRVVDAPAADDIQTHQEFHAMDVDHLDVWGPQENAGADVSAE